MYNFDTEFIVKGKNYKVRMINYLVQYFIQNQITKESYDS